MPEGFIDCNLSCEVNNDMLTEVVVPMLALSIVLISIGAIAFIDRRRWKKYNENP